MALRPVLFAAAFLCALALGVRADVETPHLRAFGPGGPHLAIQEAAEAFRGKHGISVGVVKASPRELAVKLREEADLYFTGAEYMLEEFVAENPGVLDLSTAARLPPRRIGIMVRKGNPLGVKSIGCLNAEGVDVLAAHLENIEPILAMNEEGDDISYIEVYTGSEGAKAWRDKPKIDAWITYRSWHALLKDESDFVELTCNGTLRHPMVAIASRTEKREAAQRFIDFLLSEEARPILRKHGWE